MIALVTHDMCIVTFMDMETYIVGFVRNQSDLSVAVPPIYDDEHNY